MLRTLKAFDLKNKKVLMRVDFNTPLKDSKVSDNFRIKSTLPSIKTCIESGAALTLMSHVGRPNGEYDKKLEYALQIVTGIEVFLYKVDFKLNKFR